MSEKHTTSSIKPESLPSSSSPRRYYTSRFKEVGLDTPIASLTNNPHRKMPSPHIKLGFVKEMQRRFAARWKRLLGGCGGRKRGTPPGARNAEPVGVPLGFGGNDGVGVVGLDQEWALPSITSSGFAIGSCETPRSSVLLPPAALCVPSTGRMALSVATTSDTNNSSELEEAAGSDAASEDTSPCLTYVGKGEEWTQTSDRGKQAEKLPVVTVKVEMPDRGGIRGAV